MDQLTVTRLFRGTRYEISVKRGPEKGILADGKPLAGPVVPLTDKETVKVEVTI